MSKELLVMDTVDVKLKRKSDGYIIAKTKTQMGSISQTVSSEKLYGAIGNQTIAILETQKEVSLSYRNALWDLEYLSMTQGVAIANKKVTVKKTENVKVTGTSGSLKATVTGTPFGDKAVVFDTNGTQKEVTVATKSITLPSEFTVTTGGNVTVIYDEEVTADVVTFDSATFSEYYEIEMSTICYDPETKKVIKDLYIQFDQVKPSGAFDMSFENGSALSPELTLEAMTPNGSTEMGRIFTVDRAVA